MDTTVLLWHFQHYDLTLSRMKINARRGNSPDVVGLLTHESDSGGIEGTLESSGIPRMSDNRRRFIRECRLSLRNQYDRAGLELVVQDEPTSRAILSLTADRPIREIWMNVPDGTEESGFITRLLKEVRDQRTDLSFRFLPPDVLIEADEIPMSEKAVPDTFSRFRRMVERKPYSNYRFSGFQWKDITADTAGRKRMRHWIFGIDAVAAYKETRNGLGKGDYSSRLSPHLAAGTLSAPEIGSAVAEYENTRTRNESTYWLIFELLWRDYFHWLSVRLGPRLFTPRGMKNRPSPPLQPDVVWKFAADGSAGSYPELRAGYIQGLWSSFRDWVRGTTDQPFINAIMLDLHATGWISNRARQCAASYLIHDLHVPWWWGALWFEGRLIDYSPASNWGNWAYQAGVGADTRPSRRFDPVRQERIHDPGGRYRDAVKQEGWEVPDNAVPVDFPIQPD